MIDWRLGSYSGSLNAWVRREVRQQLRENPAARRASRPVVQRFLRAFFAIGTFKQYLILYAAVDIVAVAAELVIASQAPDLLPGWSSGQQPHLDLKAVLLTVASGLIGAQVGALGVLTIAIALVTLIAQREASATDVQVYYYESLAFEVMASSIALLAVMSLQLLWPLQFLLHRMGGGTDLQFFKVMLVGLHSFWLLLNLAGLAYFVETTLRFVHQSTREKLRERYTANVLQPAEMTQRLREQLFRQAGLELLGGEGTDDDASSPHIFFGTDFDHAAAQITTTFKRPTNLVDVRVTLAQWAARSWARRCEFEAARRAQQGPAHRPLLVFTPTLGRPLHGHVEWCRRAYGVPLTRLERFVLRRAFCFRRVRNEA